MSNLSVRGEQSTSSEVTALTNLTSLADSPAGQFIRKTGPNSFENATPSGGGGGGIPPYAPVKANGTKYYGIPGMLQVSTNTVSNHQANQIKYYPMYVSQAITLTEVAVECSAFTATANIRTGIYAATAELQPYGPSLLDQVLTVTSATYFTASINVTLDPGWYLIASWADVQNQMRVVRTAPQTGINLGASGERFVNPIVSATYSTWPNPGTEWDTVGGTSEMYNFIFFLWTID